jgi:hypothetical protein
LPASAHCNAKMNYPYCCGSNGNCYVSKQQIVSSGCSDICGPFP